MVSGTTGAGCAGLHDKGPAAELRGEGRPTVKSAALLSVSVQGLVRETDVVLDVVAAAGASDTTAELAPYPTRSTTPDAFARSTRPAVALMAASPVTSGVASGSPTVPPDICTR